jgi:hypothetical protein
MKAEFNGAEKADDNLRKRTDRRQTAGLVRILATTCISTGAYADPSSGKSSAMADR